MLLLLTLTLQWITGLLRSNSLIVSLSRLISRDCLCQVNQIQSLISQDFILSPISIKVFPNIDANTNLSSHFFHTLHTIHYWPCLMGGTMVENKERTFSQLFPNLSWIYVSTIIMLRPWYITLYFNPLLTVLAGWHHAGWRIRSGPTFAAPQPPPDVSCSAQLLSEHAYHYAA